MPTNNPSLHYIDAGKLAPTGDHSNCERFWANIKAQHAAIYGPDSAYNFAVCNEHGIRMVGRGWDRDSAANGQENGVDYNPGSRALVALMGSDDVPTPQFEQAVNAFAREAYARGMEAPLRPHSSFVATSCPGDRLRALVEEVNAGLPSVASVSEPEEAPEMIYSTTDNGEATYYRDAGGILVKLKPEEAAPYYGKVPIINLGGGLAALAFNAKTLAARKQLGG